MQLLTILTTLFSVATFAAAVPQTGSLPVAIIPTGDECLVAVPQLCASGTCTADTGLVAAVFGVCEDAIHPMQPADFPLNRLALEQDGQALGYRMLASRPTTVLPRVRIVSRFLQNTDMS